ncbi:MAG: hypothetical protein GWO85_00500 [Simkaniaceae bacterium]|nr:hypothetical protein [Simkaniaceae bacterium]
MPQEAHRKAVLGVFFAIKVKEINGGKLLNALIKLNQEGFYLMPLYPELSEIRAK